MLLFLTPPHYFFSLQCHRQLRPKQEKVQYIWPLKENSFSPLTEFRLSIRKMDGGSHVTIIIDEHGRVNKTKLLEIHNNITTKIKQYDDALGMQYGFYIVRTYKFLKTLKPPKTNNLIEMFQQDVIIKVKLDSLLDYISIGREYIQISLQQKQNTICPHCNTMLVVEKTEGELMCEECGFVYDTRLPGIKDLESINTCRSYYSLKSNLLKAIQRFEGKNISVTNKDIDKIRTELKKRQITPSLLKTEHVMSVLKDLKMDNYYDEIYSLISVLSHRVKKPIQPYIPKLLKLHDELEHAYSFVKNPSRTNSLNVYFKLYKLLKLCDKDFDISDLCILKTEQKFEEHEEKWKEICKITGWKDDLS